LPCKAPVFLAAMPTRLARRPAASASSTAVVAPRSAALTAYRRSYEKKSGQPDPHVAVFRGAVAAAQPHQLDGGGGGEGRVLYPGCHRHITASLCFGRVDYVDCDVKVGDVFVDAAVRQWVELQLRRQQPEAEPLSFCRPEWSFTCATYDSLQKHFAPESFDWLISLSAGIVSLPCLTFLKPGGFFLVNDSHGDASAARTAAAPLLLRAVHVDGEWSDDALDAYFVTVRGAPLTRQQAREAAEVGAKARLLPFPEAPRGRWRR